MRNFDDPHGCDELRRKEIAQDRLLEVDKPHVLTTSIAMTPILYRPVPANDSSKRSDGESGRASTRLPVNVPYVVANLLGVPASRFHALPALGRVRQNHVFNPKGEVLCDLGYESTYRLASPTNS